MDIEIGDLPTNAQRRRRAAELNLAQFMPVAPCKRGHNAKRYTANGGCVECMSVRRTVAPNDVRAVYQHPVAYAPALSYPQRVALQNYLGRCIMAWHESQGLRAPIDENKLRTGEMQGRPYTDFG